VDPPLTVLIPHTDMSTIEQQQHHSSVQDTEKKDDVYTADVQPVYDVNELEAGGQKDERLIYDNIPDGVNPDVVREEKVIRGLKQRHVQVSMRILIGQL
jgi:hypothetical protein